MKGFINTFFYFSHENTIFYESQMVWGEPVNKSNTLQNNNKCINQTYKTAPLWIRFSPLILSDNH